MTGVLKGIGMTSRTRKTISEVCLTFGIVGCLAFAIWSIPTEELPKQVYYRVIGYSDDWQTVIGEWVTASYMVLPRSGYLKLSDGTLFNGNFKIEPISENLDDNGN